MYSIRYVEEGRCSVHVHACGVYNNVPVCFLVEDGNALFCLTLVSERTDNILELDVRSRYGLFQEWLDVCTQVSRGCW